MKDELGERPHAESNTFVTLRSVKYKTVVDSGASI